MMLHELALFFLCFQLADGGRAVLNVHKAAAEEADVTFMEAVEAAEAKKAKMITTFVANEHKALGDAGYKQWMERFNSEEYQKLLTGAGDQFPSLLKEKLNELSMPRGGNSVLSLGDFVYLQGDFFSGDLNAEGLQEVPTSGSEQIQESAGRGELKGMLAWIDKQATLGLLEDETFIWRNLKSIYHRGREYVRLAEKNSNHFSHLAVKEYTQVHEAAKQMASAAGKICKANGTGSAIGLKNAFMVDGSALHYLSDLYAAGHLRVPRAHLSEICPIKTRAGGKLDIFRLTKTPCSGLMTKAMHDEDGSLGLNVTVNGETYESFGDELYNLPRSGRDRHFAVLAVSASVDEVFQTFLMGCLNTNTPSPLKVGIPQVAKDAPSHPPLFKVEDGHLMGRVVAIEKIEAGEPVKYKRISESCTKDESDDCIHCKRMLKKYAKKFQKYAKAYKAKLEQDVRELVRSDGDDDDDD
eukprot:TRINITY_DN95423_c0_g1_i1.p1 TRINITY_DN95423_c0_g1~~TRINITY_DN95423_c0_g1_i1.p1  ORF type:complete len:468 (+),score=90.33 TRINITY_DN95423_c0_g1_i1:96-1499(+)